MKGICIFVLLAAIVLTGCGGDKPAPAPEPTKPVSSKLCPQDAPAGKSFDADSLVGQTLADAKATAKQHGCSVRVVELDGKPQAATMDFRQDRVNVAVTDGRVSGVQGVS